MPSDALMSVPRKDLEDLLEGVRRTQETLGSVRQGVEDLEARLLSREEELASVKAELADAKAA
jgi:flagellin-like hook-associated protein FlgL